MKYKMTRLICGLCFTLNGSLALAGGFTVTDEASGEQRYCQYEAKQEFARNVLLLECKAIENARADKQDNEDLVNIEAPQELSSRGDAIEIVKLAQDQYRDCVLEQTCLPILQPFDPRWHSDDNADFIAIITDQNYGLSFRTDGRVPAGMRCAAIQETVPAKNVWSTKKNLLCTNQNRVFIGYTFAFNNPEYDSQNAMQGFDRNSNPYACFSAKVLTDKVLQDGRNVWSDNCILLKIR